MIFLPQIFRAWPTGWFRRRSSEYEPHCRFGPDARWQRGASNGHPSSVMRGSKVPARAVDQRKPV
jgi:hypothetical protein